MSCRYSVALTAALYPALLEAPAIRISEYARASQQVIVPLTLELLASVEGHHPPTVFLVMVKLALVHAAICGGGKDTESLTHILHYRLRFHDAMGNLSHTLKNSPS